MKLLSASHIFILVRAFDQSEGDVLELGTGYFSTLLLNWMGQISSRKVVSYETVAKWADRAKRVCRSRNHKVYFEPDLDKANLTDRHWGLVFIDHAPADRRIVDILRLKDHADFIVVHDTEPELDHDYHYSDIYKHFKYVYQDTKHLPNTAVLSNFKEFKS